MYVESFDKLNRTASKYSYISCLIPVGIFALLDYRYRLRFSLLTDKGKIALVFRLSAIFIGVLLIAIAVFAFMPKETRYYQVFYKYGHNKIFAISCRLSTAFFLLHIFLRLYSSTTTTIGLYSFISGVAELLVVLYYVFRIVTDGYKF